MSRSGEGAPDDQTAAAPAAGGGQPGAPGPAEPAAPKSARRAELSGRLRLSELRAAWPLLSGKERLQGFQLLQRPDQERLFFRLKSKDRSDLMLSLPAEHRRGWLRILDPDDAADVIQLAPPGKRPALIALLDDQTRMEVGVLLAYEEDRAGGLMNPRYARVRPDMTIDEAILYMRRQTRGEVETISYAYVLDADQRLVGVLSVRDLFAAAAGKKVSEVMRTEMVTAPVEADQEALSQLFAHHRFTAIPVVESDGRMRGIVTMDDMLSVLQEAATEDMHKMGGTAALAAPYLGVGVLGMIRKRAGWLVVLFLGEMLTAAAMAFFEAELARAVMLAMFIPLIISSGGNSGSQAATLVIRAMALGEVRLRDWWTVVRREFAAGLVLGALLGIIGFVRVVAWQQVRPVYGDHFVEVGQAVAMSLMGVVLFGTIVGSMLPFVLRRLGLDPATASTPFVATLVDVAGVVIYFSAAKITLTGLLL